MDDHEKNEKQELELPEKTGCENLTEEQMTRMILIVCVAFMVLLIAVTRSIFQEQNDETAKSALVTEEVNGNETTDKPNSNYVIVTEKEEQELQTAAAESTVSQNPETETAEQENWNQTIFGSVSSGVCTSQIQVAGLSSYEIEVTNFRESDFIKSVSSFLGQKEITTTKITFESVTDCSAESAIVYLAAIEGYPEEQLTVIMYPEYAGQYLYILEHLKQENRETETVQTETVQTETAALQTEAVQVQIQSQTQQPAQTERSYDASRLSVYSIPKELLNYIDNQYILQYTLYDYLYKNGLDTVTSATVTGYSIDGDTRSAEIIFVLDNGTTVTGIYDKADGSYLFS